MRFALLLAAALIVAAPLAAAGGVHDGPEAVSMSMFIHHTSDGLLLNPVDPATNGTSTQELSLACDAPATWTARFVRSIDDPAQDTLARVADFDETSPRLRWHMETVAPGTDQPVPRAPVPMQITAALLSGDEVVIAAGSTTTTEAMTVEGRHVIRVDFSMPWSDNERTIPADTLTLRVTAAIADPADCGAAPIGLRPYADGEHVNRILWDLYDPVSMDRFDIGWAGDALLIRVHASSPWGTMHLAAPTAPTMLGPTNGLAAPVLDSMDDGDVLAATWAWDASGAVNGTYRVDVRAAIADGTVEVNNFTTFRIGGDAPEPTPQAAPVKDTPGFAVPAALFCLALVRRISR